MIQLLLPSPPIFKTVQVNVYARLMKSFYFIKKVENATIVNGVGYVKAYNM